MQWSRGHHSELGHIHYSQIRWPDGGSVRVNRGSYRKSFISLRFFTVSSNFLTIKKFTDICMRTNMNIQFVFVCPCPTRLHALHASLLVNTSSARNVATLAIKPWLWTISSNLFSPTTVAVPASNPHRWALSCMSELRPLHRSIITSHK